VVLDHTFEVADDDARARIAAAVDHNSEQELAALGRIAELGYPLDEVVDTFSDTVELPGSTEDGYEFVNRSDLWPTRLPHVLRVALTEDEPGVQHMEMDTVTAGGGAHTTRSIRLCFPSGRIVYKQLLPPEILFGHSGEWTFVQGESGVTVVATHTVAINPTAARAVLGESSTLADARQYLRDALGGNGRATVRHAGEYMRARQVGHV
jgi:aromatase